jgi:hypothetical protein
VRYGRFRVCVMRRWPVCNPRWTSLLGCALLAAGCASDRDTARSCLALQKVPLYYASEDPQDLELSNAERAAIGMVMPRPPTALCTGVLIRPGVVLSAAHCDVGNGVTFRASFAGARVLEAAMVTLHPTYDAMLLQFERGTELDTLEPIALWSSRIDESWIGRQVTLAGVGETETGDYGQLRFVNEPVIGVNETEIGVDGMGRSGACSGDSGGPLLVAGGDGRARVAGILDRGSRDCIGLDIYVRADVLLDWVAEVTDKSCVNP